MSTKQRRKRRVHRRDGYTCQYCGDELRPSTATVDHVVPLSRGGSKLTTNLVSSCFRCNQHKADRTPGEAGMEVTAPACDSPSFGPQRGFEGST